MKQNKKNAPDINSTRQKRVKQTRHDSENKYRTLIEQASDGIHTYDFQGNFIETNSKLCEMLGYTSEELLKMNVKDLVPAEDLAANPIRFDELREGKTLLKERRLLRKDGSLIPVEISGKMIQEGVLQGIIRNISERKRMEAALHSYIDRLRLITDAIPLLISYVDKEHHYRFVNQTYIEWFGQPQEQIIGKHLSEILGDEAYRSILPEIEKVLSGEQVIFERSVPYKSGERFIHVNYIPDFDVATEEVKGFNAFVQDITERKQSEEALRKSEEWLRAIFDASRDGILVEYDERIIYVNKSYTHLFGYDSPEELIGKHVSTVISSEDVNRMLELGKKRARGEPSTSIYEFKGKQKDERLINVEASVSTSTIAGRAYITTMVRDIAERRQAEKALRESKELLQKTIDALTSHIAVLDKNGVIIKVNAAWREFAGQNSFAGRNYGIGSGYIESCMPEKSSDSDDNNSFGRIAAEGITDVINGKYPLFELEYSCHSPSDIRWFLMRVTRFGADENLRVVVAHENITTRKLALLEREQAEEQLRRSHEELEQKVQERTRELKEANETLQAEIIERRQAEKDRVRVLRQLVTAQEDERKRIARDLHDHLGQQLIAMRLKLEILKRTSGEDERIVKQIDELLQVTKKIDSDVDFLAWNIRPSALDDIGLVAALDRYVHEWSKLFGISVDFDASRLSPQRFAPEAETNLYRIVQEALNNVAKHAGAKSVDILLKSRDGSVVMIIEDNGGGFSPERLVLKGKNAKGMGLIGMRERAALIGGTLEIESAKGKGTTIYIKIPASNVKRR